MDGEIVTVEIKNRTANRASTRFSCSAASVAKIVVWYASHCSGDKFTVRIDGKIVPHDVNGYIAENWAESKSTGGAGA